MPALSKPSPPQWLARRHWLMACACMAVPAPGLLQAAEPGPAGLLFLGFELLDEQPDPARAPEHRERLARISQQMAQGLQAQGLYQVVDAEPVRERVAAARAQSEFLYRCNGCLGALAEAAGARYAGVGWVQRVSNLILNLNIELRDARDDRLVLTKSVDIRGDNDEAWRRGVAYMLRDMAERRARQPGYGLTPGG